MEDIIILGAGGLAREVAFLIDEINRRQPTWKIVGFADANRDSIGTPIGRHQIICSEDDLLKMNIAAAVGIGNPKVIAKIGERFRQTELRVDTVASVGTVGNGWATNQRVRRFMGECPCLPCCLLSEKRGAEDHQAAKDIRASSARALFIGRVRALDGHVCPRGDIGHNAVQRGSNFRRGGARRRMEVPIERVVRRTGVDGCHRACVARVDRQQKRPGLRPAALANDDPGGLAAQGVVLQQLCLGDLSQPLADHYSPHLPLRKGSLYPYSTECSVAA